MKLKFGLASKSPAKDQIDKKSVAKSEVSAAGSDENFEEKTIAVAFDGPSESGRGISKSSKKKQPRNLKKFKKISPKDDLDDYSQKTIKKANKTADKKSNTKVITNQNSCYCFKNLI